MKKSNIATCLLGLVACSVPIIIWIVALVLYALPTSKYNYLLADTNNYTSLLLSFAILSYGIVPFTAFIGSIINGFNSLTGGIFMFMAALFGCVLPISFFLVKTYVLGFVLIIPVVLFLGLGLWSVLTKPRVQPGKVYHEAKKRNFYVMAIGIVVSVVGVILSVLYSYSLTIKDPIVADIGISTIIVLVSVATTIGCSIGFFGSFLAGFTSVAGGVFLLLGSITCLAFPIVHFIFAGIDTNVIYISISVAVFWILGIWALCTKQKIKTYTGPNINSGNNQSQNSMQQNYNKYQPPNNSYQPQYDQPQYYECSKKENDQPQYVQPPQIISENVNKNDSNNDNNI